MRENIINFCSQYQYPQEAKEELLSVYDAVSDTAAVKEIFSQARQEYELWDSDTLQDIHRLEACLTMKETE